MDVSRVELLEQVERILASKSFGGSETMRQLLQYLGVRTVESPDQHPKEHEIAVSLLGRPSNFDPKLDPVVRVQTSRLRSKLAEYYVAEGTADRIYLEVPKGSYCLHASMRGTAEVPVHPTTSGGNAGFRRRLIWCAAIAALLTVGGVGVWRMTATPGDHRLRQFWRPFLESGKEPLIVFANPKFVGSSSSSLRLFDPEKDRAEAVNPGYAGVGEVMGASEVTRMFSSLGRLIRLRRSQLFSWDDAKAYNLIFLGAPPHNVALFQVPLGRKLKIKPYSEDPRRNEGCVQNLFPQGKEENFYCAYEEGPTRVEYSLVTLSAGVDQSKAVLVVAGTTTFGTQATIEYLCDPERVAAVNRALGTGAGETTVPFDALFRCRIRGGVPVGAELVLVKK